jgi:dDENN domain
LFQSYRTHLIGGEFRAADFLMSLNLSDRSTEFVHEVLKTQLFQNFVEERRDCPSDPEVLFFDDTINAKFNRSKKATLTLRKKETAFLDDTRSLVSVRLI